jgi:uncharacterized membrane protein
VKKYFLIFIFALIFIPNLFNPFSFAGDESNFNDFSTQVLYNNSKEIITNFSSDIFVNKDNSIHVTEKITYDFKDLEKHGIYRFIPLSKPVGAVRNLKITDISVTDEKGISYNFEQTGGTTINLKIGDADKLITGKHVYVIKYKILNPIGYFNNYDEIYWNATGNEWQVPIIDSISSVYLPGDLTNSKLQIASYCDYIGQNKPCVNGNAVYDAINDQTIISFATPKDFYYGSGYGMSVAVGFPKGIIDPAVLNWYEKPNTYIYVAYGVGIIFALLFLHLIFIKFLPEYNKRKRPIVAQFEPPQDFLPSQSGLVYRLFGLSNSKILTADILYLASLGYIKIESKPVIQDNKKNAQIIGILKIVVPLIIICAFFSLLFSLKFFILVVIIGVIFQRNKIKSTINLIKNPTEFSISRILNKDISLLPDKLNPLISLYELISKSDKPVTLGDLSKEKKYYEFQDYINKIKESVKEKNVEPKKSISFLKGVMRVFTFIFFIFFIFIFVAFLMFTADNVGINNLPNQAWIPIIIIFSGIVLYKIIKAIIRWILSKMTESWYSVAGLHRYIKIAEKNRIQFESDPAKAERIFSTLLPYAVAFGLEYKWIHVFDGIMIKPLEWYSGSDISDLSYSLGAFSIAMSSTSSSGAPVSSSGGSDGGGSSGGGGGGGGGGSW